LIHGARAVFRYTEDPTNKIRVRATKVEKRSGVNKAAVAVAHKNARIMFSMFKNGTLFGEREKEIRRAKILAKDNSRTAAP
jgi:hypothetical protein